MRRNKKQIIELEEVTLTFENRRQQKRSVHTRQLVSRETISTTLRTEKTCHGAGSSVFTINNNNSGVLGKCKLQPRVYIPHDTDSCTAVTQSVCEDLPGIELGATLTTALDYSTVVLLHKYQVSFKRKI